MEPKPLDHGGYLRLIINLEGRKKKAVVYFGGTWCPDCQKALPLLEELIPEYSKYYNFYKVDVGTRQEFKHVDNNHNPTNPFKTSEDAKIQEIPTIIVYGKQELARLGEKACQDKERLEELLERFKEYD